MLMLYPIPNHFWSSDYCKRLPIDALNRGLILGFEAEIHYALFISRKGIGVVNKCLLISIVLFSTGVAFRHFAQPFSDLYTKSRPQTSSKSSGHISSSVFMTDSVHPRLFNVAGTDKFIPMQ